MHRIIRALAAALAAASLASPAHAHLRLPAIIGDNMVLQRDQPNRVWGWHDPGAQVTVEIAGQKKQAKVGPDGRWTITLDPLPATKPGAPALTMKITGGETRELKNILVGEVWLCSGQSNMQWTLGTSCDADLELLSSKFPRLRLISVPQVGIQEPQDDFKGQWDEATNPEVIKQFTAVGFFYGRLLHQILDVPVGLIDNAWGGSSAEAWIRRDILEKDAFYKPLMDRWQETEKTYNWEKELEKHKTAVEAWKQRVADAKAKGLRPPPPLRPPTNALTGQHRPGNLYCGVLHPIIGYGIRGVIWYQGESNAGRAFEYRKLFPLMIQHWRDEWQLPAAAGNFPFYWVQLADFKPEQPQPVESDWAELREAQTLTMKLPNTGQAVITDLGEAKDIHPKNKRDVAERLARWALAKDYGIQVPYRSPELKECRIDGTNVFVTLDHVGTGLATFDVLDVRGFALCGGDTNFVWASAEILNTNTVRVSSPSVAKPVAVRYAWADNPVCNLFSSDGLPVTPFRSDNFPMITQPKDATPKP